MAESSFGDRYEVIRRLGEGGMGVVYEAFDKKLGAAVALKTMRFADPAALYRFKKEFRALADVSHSNLVGLYELFAEQQLPFFTMELVDGVTFLEWVRPPRSRLADAALDDPFDLLGSTSRIEISPSITAPANPLDVERLRAVMAQLVRGVMALHAAGKLHRDIKPTNVLVTREGRAVLLDFGLVTTVLPGEMTQADGAGTAEYMAPEQATGAELNEAADWYAVGSVLFEALTNTLPFVGPRLRVMMAKQQSEAPRASSLAPGVPADLDELCAKLLARDPAQRPSAGAILAAFGDESATPEAKTTPSLRSQGTMESPFIGRGKHLAALESAFDACRRSKSVMMHVHGPSGMGKTLLVRRFVEVLAQRDETVVLGGRCYERESLPYKGFDAVIDALARWMQRQKREVTAALIPREIHALARVFPVLGRVEAVASAPKRRTEIGDPHELRRRAFGATRELLARIADRSPLVVWIDDLQWGDLDSVNLLAELTRAPDPPPVLWIASYRDEDIASNPVLGALSQLERNSDFAAERRTIKVDALGVDDATELALTLMPGGDARLRTLAKRVAEESGGSPAFIDELVRHVNSGASLRESTMGRSIRLSDVLGERIDTLPAPARALLEIVSVAGRPIEASVAARAAEISAEQEPTAIAVLRAAHLLRTTRTGTLTQLEAYHQRVRDAVLAALDPAQLAARHGRIALSLEVTGKDDPEAMARHLQGAGDLRRAGVFAERAAANAAATLAFERAASLYEQAIQWASSTPEQARVLQQQLGQALANAGRGAEAARAFLAAATGAKAADAIDLRRRAAEQLLRSGHVDEGLAAIAEVLSAVGMKLAPSPRAALFSIVTRRGFIALRGLGYRPRDESQISAEELQRIDVAWSVATGLGVVDTIRAFDFQTRQLLMALRVGEKSRIGRALAGEIVNSALTGENPRTEGIANRARKLAEDTALPSLPPLISGYRGAAYMLEGNYRRGLEELEKATRLFRENTVGTSWELDTARLFSMWCLWYLGETLELTRRLPLELAEGRERGDLYFVTNLRTGLTNSAYLVLDDPARARNESVEAMRSWSQGAAHLQHYYEMLAHAHIDLYEGAALRALERIDALWKRLDGALLFRLERVRVEALHLRARAAIAAAASSSDPERLLKRAQADAARLASKKPLWGQAIAHLALAGVAGAEGRPELAIRELEQSIAACDQAELGMYGALGRHRLAAVVGGERGQSLQREAARWIDGSGVRNLERFAATFAPGFVPLGGRKLLRS